jgi:sugar phosphate isomerase/epimerase
MQYYFFPKFLQQFSADELMEATAEAGLDGPAAIIREGYWVEESNLEMDLRNFLAAAERAGLKVTHAASSYSLETLAEEPEPLKILAGQGIRTVRAGYIHRGVVSHPRHLAGHARRLAEAAAESAEKAGLKIVIQVHGGAYPHNASCAWPMVKGLNSGHIGIMLDPGNNVCQEGTEDFGYQVALCGEYFAALGVKDAVPSPVDSEVDGRWWRKDFAPVDEGENNWREIFQNTLQADFDGPLVLMPFYHEKEPRKLLEVLKREVKYVKKLVMRG